MARIILLLAFIVCSVFSFAQIREIPKEVKETFTTQYSGAQNVNYEDKLVTVQVHFQLNGENMIAAYTNKGRWKETEKDWSYDQLPDVVKDGFQKSKYADWKVTSVKMIYRPGGADRYRIKVEKNDVQKKYVYFNKTGRLVEDSITI